MFHRDERGAFLEVFKSSRFAEAASRPFDLHQANTSVSKRGVLRGIHFADVPPGQAKYVTVSRGSILDFVVDLRVGSPSFGEWECVEVDDSKRNAVFIPEGVGHAFLAMSDDAVVTYFCSDEYRPGHEHAVNPLDPELGLEFLIPTEELIVSEKDQLAPGLTAALEQGLLPTWGQYESRLRDLRSANGANS